MEDVECSVGRCSKAPPEGYILPPNQVLTMPSLAELSSHWPGMSLKQIEVWHKDYEEEGI
jgi:hypothetical protein